LDRNVALI